MPAAIAIAATRSAAYSLPMPPRSISIPARGRRTERPSRSTARQSTNASSASTSPRSGTRGGERRKSQARRSTPEVMSKRPPDARWHASAYASSADVSSSIATGAPPAARLIADTTLPSR